MQTLIHEESLIWDSAKPYSIFVYTLRTYISYSPVIVYHQFFSNGILKQPTDWATFATYVSGTIGTLIGLVSIILLYQTLRSQTKLSRLQQFESSFFSLLENQREIIKPMKGNLPFKVNSIHSDSVISGEGLYFIEGIAKSIEQKLKQGTKWVDDEKVGPYTFDDLNRCQQHVNYYFCKDYNQYKAQLGHYFRHLYHIIKYVDESGIENRKKYIDLIQAQMSDDELFITMLNAISDMGRDRFLPLLVRYHFFENISSRGVDFDKMRQLFFPGLKFKSYNPTTPPSVREVNTINPYPQLH